METAELCGMCGLREMQRAQTKTPDVVFMMCPNCDDPKGIMPERDDDEDEDGTAPV